MATEPEKKVEEALHAYARKRREDAGAPLEMHPATRRMLQGEVAKLKAAQPPERRRWWESALLLWPRFAAAVGMLAVLATGVWVFTQGENGKLNETAQVASYRPAAQESEFPDGQKKDLAELKAEADHLSAATPATEDFGRQWALHRPAEVMYNPPSKSQLGDAETAPPASRPEVTREKQITLQYDTPAQQPVILGESLLVQNAADKSADVAFFDERAGEAKRYYKIQDGRFVQDRVDPTAPITSAVTLSAVGQRVDTYSFGVVDTNAVGLFANLGVVTTPPVEPATGLPKNELPRLSGIQPTDGVAAAAVGQEFERQDATGPALLQKFQLEQHANGRISIRDADGSVYEGEILAAKSDDALGDKAKLAKEELREADRKRVAPRAARAASTAPTSSISFRASGTNRNKQLVVINGELLHEDEQLSRERLLVGGKAAAAPTTPAPAEFEAARRELRVQTGAANARLPERASGVSTSAPPTVIRARVQIGPTNQLELRAIRTR